MLRTAAGTLDDILGILNDAVDRWNADVDKELDIGDIDAKHAALVKLTPGVVTAELVASEEPLPKYLQKCLGELLIQADAEEIVKIAKAVTNPTKTILDRKRGAAKANTKDPVLVPAIHFAHLLAVYESQQAKPAPSPACETWAPEI